MSRFIRQFHRWTSVAFTATVVSYVVVIAKGGGTPPAWMTYAPLLPLALLQISGLYLFVLLYFARKRGASGAG